MKRDERRLRSAFRLLNRNMMVLWRLGLGRYMANPMVGYIMVLATTGRRSGARRLVPLNFAEGGDAVYCLAGFGKTTHWLLNLEADPECDVWLPDGRHLRGHGELVATEADRIDMVRKLLARSGFAAKLAEPGVDLLTAADDAIAELGPQSGRQYEVVRIELGDAITGSGRPDDLMWLWPVFGLTGTVVWLACRYRRSLTNKGRQSMGIADRRRTLSAGRGASPRLR